MTWQWYTLFYRGHSPTIRIHRDKFFEEPGWNWPRLHKEGKHSNRGRVLHTPHSAGTDHWRLRSRWKPLQQKKQHIITCRLYWQPHRMGHGHHRNLKCIWMDGSPFKYIFLKECFVCCFKFHWSLFLWVRLKLALIGLDNGLVPEWQQTSSWSDVDRCIYVWPDLSGPFY